MKQYIYAHTEPSGEIVYIGRGSGTRCLCSHKRDTEHRDFILSGINERGLDFVEILQTGLTYDKAKLVERDLIKTLKPRFNRQMNGAANAGRGEANHNARFTPEEVNVIRREWLSYRGSLRSFHRMKRPDVAWTTFRKVILRESYREE